MKPEFHEDYQSPHVDPLDGRVLDFDWPQLERLLEEVEPTDARTPDISLLGEVLCRLFGWLTHGKKLPSEGLDRLIGRRAIAMIWVIRPDLIEGTPSLATLAKQLGETRAGLSWHASDFTRVFGLRNRGQAAGWNRKPLNHPPGLNGTHRIGPGGPLPFAASPTLPAAQGGSQPKPAPTNDGSAVTKESFRGQPKGRSGSSPENARRQSKSKVP